MDLCGFAVFQFSMDLCAFSYVMIRIKLRTYVISLLHGTNFAYDKGIFYFLFYAGTVPARYPYSDLECCGTVPVLTPFNGFICICHFSIFNGFTYVCAFSYVMIRIKLRAYAISLPHRTNFAYNRGIFYFLFYAGKLPPVLKKSLHLVFTVLQLSYL